ncbi:MAG: zinc-binding dehydrogenase [Dehalococcoidia bacterium]|nr:zinc-binding dehydrogenase [Dehalococcoidia bacterium]
MARAVVVRETGGPEVLKVEEHAVPNPGEDEARVRVAAAGINFRDTLMRAGSGTPPLPWIPGNDGSGVVEEIGPGVTGLKVGDRVCWTGGGTYGGAYASETTLPAERLVRVLDGVSDEQAAAVPVQGMTAHYLVKSTRVTSPGDSALVHAVAGGVGLLLTQMLKAAGATVIGTCSSDDKAALAREMGADEIIRYDREDLHEAVMRITGGAGVDVVYDSVGKSTFDAGLASLKTRGMMVLYGSASGDVPPLNLARLNERGTFVTRPSLVHYARDRSEVEWRTNEVLEAVASGQLRVHIGGRYSLDKAAQAHRDMSARGTVGKLILTP